MKVNTKKFLDFDEFAEIIRDVDCVMMFQNPDRQVWKVKQVKLADVDLQFGQLGSGNIVEGVSHLGGFLFYLPLTPGVRYAINGETMRKNTVMISTPGAPICVSTRQAHDWFSVYVPSSVFKKHGFLICSESGQGLENRGCFVSRPDERLFRNLLLTVHEIMEAVEISQEFLDSQVSVLIENRLVHLCAELLIQNKTAISNTAGRPKIPRHKIIKQCRNLDEEVMSSQVAIPDLADICDVSERTLRGIFQDYYLTPPNSYFRLKKLHRIHGALKEAGETSKVTDILAQNWAFEFGHAGADYRSLFGESPSETLRRTQA